MLKNLSLAVILILLSWHQPALPADACLVTTAGGYENLRHDFNVFLVEDATLATWSSAPGPGAATAAAVGEIGRVLAVTRTDWVE